MEHIHHIYVTIFINEKFTHLIKKGQTIPCDTLKDFMVYSNDLMPNILSTLGEEKTTFRTFGNKLAGLDFEVFSFIIQTKSHPIEKSNQILIHVAV